MSAIQKVFQIYGPNYPALYGNRILHIHKKAIQDIIDCRSGSFGMIVYGCNDCHTLQSIACCCGNRHCPTCQHDKADQWLHKQMENCLHIISKKVNPRQTVYRLNSNRISGCAPYLGKHAAVSPHLTWLSRVEPYLKKKIYGYSQDKTYSSTPNPRPISSKLSSGILSKRLNSSIK
ncbi:MAG: transposase zinc-binding domain-containing protein [Thermodesulfobacteriota bacterium]|nr:transposase zinc-binding domain-containing protein [Thermodesulfobacteriota bacterium]